MHKEAGLLKVAIHQPNYLPWLGFFNKVSMADVYVILDSVQYEKGGFSNRNKIRTLDYDTGWKWLTVPVKKGGSNNLLKDVEIDNNQQWKKKTCINININYNKAPFFDEYYDILQDIYNKDLDNLCKLNVNIIYELFKIFKINPKIIYSSEMNIEEKKSNLILEICKKLNATTYISGISGKNYLDIESFKTAGIDIIFQEYKHPVYRQVYQPFIPNMSAIDLLFNHGLESENIIKNNKSESEEFIKN